MRATSWAYYHGHHGHGNKIMKLKELSGNSQAQKEEKFESHMKVKTWPAFHMLKASFPQKFVDEINGYIDEVVIPQNESFADGLVGQIRQNKKSAQLDLPLTGHTIGEEFKKVLDNCATVYMKQAYKRESKADAFQCWTVHSYEGDYNPLHSHGVHTLAGLSSIMYLKVPECISNPKLKNTDTLHEASGLVDGWTQFVWGVNTAKDIYQLRPITEEYIRPEVGKLLIFPCWLDHQVMPFYGEGERRTLSANFNIYYSDEEKEKYLSNREKANRKKVIS